MLAGGTDFLTAPYTIDQAGNCTLRQTADSIHSIDIGAILTNIDAPTFTPPGGNFDTALDVIINKHCTGAAIYYTTDGSTPTTGSTLYTAAVHLTATTTIKAIVVKFGVSSPVGSQLFTKNAVAGDTVANPVLSPLAGTYTPTGGSQVVTATCSTSGASMRYTIDGTTPSSTVGTVIASGGTINLTPGTTTVKIIAYKAGSANSGEVDATYIVNSGGSGSGTQVADVGFTVVTGTEGITPVTVHLDCATTGATTQYRAWTGTSYGAWTTATSAVVQLDRYIQAKATKVGMTDSTVTEYYNYST
jgi:hypothetical protein